MSKDWLSIKPGVNVAREFLEITGDFGEPLEIVREAISNAIDWNASFIEIKFEVKKYKGVQRLFIEFLDDGEGMNRKIISQDFWGLGFSNSRDDENKIGEKGHGTKIYLNSERVDVITKGPEGVFESYCNGPLANLNEGKLHEPFVREEDSFLENRPDTVTGTKITVIGYNDNVRKDFIQDIVRDYILWFTKVGSIEKEFEHEKLDNFKVYLTCLDAEKKEEIEFGHLFPEENDDINKLFDEYGSGAADHYVRKYVFPGQRLKEHPEVTYDSIYFIEGDKAKRKYNPLISARRDSRTGAYRVSDRYGVWVCKDYIPIIRKNEWITSFGTGSNSFVLIHGFVNCQKLELTANRGDISNTDPGILEELKNEVMKEIRLIDIDLKNKGVYFLREQIQIDKSMDQEKAEFARRIKDIKNRPHAKYEDLTLYEPRNESEVFGLLITLISLAPDIFDFSPIDYNTSNGIDIIALNKKADKIIEGKYAYIELKHTLRRKFNHAFEYLRWIVCWDLARDIKPGSEFVGLKGEDDTREFEIDEDKDGNKNYFLKGRGKAHRIEIISLKELINKKLKIIFSK